MEKLRDKYKEDISDRIANARSNALALAGVLADDGPSTSASARPSTQSVVTPGSVSILGSAAAATSGTGAASADAAPAQPANSRVGLLRALLAVGAFEDAFFILSNYPWISDPLPEIAELLLRICNHSISAHYRNSVSPTTAAKSSESSDLEHLTTARARYSVPDKKIIAPQASAHVITGRPVDHPRTIAGQWRVPVYFFSQWQDRLPTASSSDEVLDILGPMLKLIGVNAWRNQEFFTRVLRIARVETLTVQANRSAWEGIIRMHLIPALSLSHPNPANSVEFWEVLRNFTCVQRFQFYGEWKDRSYKRFPEMRVRRAEAERDAKSLLKRLSVDNVKQFGRSLAKVAHCNPCVLFEIALNQVQSYDNLVGPVVESVRYLTPLGYDVLGYSLLDALSNPEKERTKTDGTNISLWLQSLATFAGTLCRRWSIDVSVILQYILNQLRDGNPKDLVVLRELITKMAGIEPVADLSDSQVIALGGGRTLQSEAINPTTAVEKKSATKRSTTRLKTALADSNLIVPLLVAVALQRQKCVYGDENAPLKYLGNLFDQVRGRRKGPWLGRSAGLFADMTHSSSFLTFQWLQCQQVLFQYFDFLLSHFTPEQLATMLPDLETLWAKYGIEANICFQILRPSLQKAIQVSLMTGRLKGQTCSSSRRKLTTAVLLPHSPCYQIYNSEAQAAVEARLKQEAKAAREKAEAAKAAASASTASTSTAAPTEDVKPEIAQSINAADGDASVPESLLGDGDVKMIEATEEPPRVAKAPIKVGTPLPYSSVVAELLLIPLSSSYQKFTWHPALQPCIEVAERQLSANVKRFMTSGFFVTFWQLSLYDIFVPSKRYLAEADRLNAIVRELDQALRVPSLPAYPGQVVDRAAEAEKKKAKERCLAVADALLADMKAHAEAFEATKKRLQLEKMHWFSESTRSGI